MKPDEHKILCIKNDNVLPKSVTLKWYPVGTHFMTGLPKLLLGTLKMAMNTI